MDIEKMLQRAPIAERGISVVIPADNHSRLAEIVAGLASLMEEMSRGHEIILVIDGSNDSIGASAGEVAAKNRHVRVLSHPSAQGYGAALRAGLRVAKYPLVLQIDLDNQYDIRQLDQMLQAIDAADIVCGYRQKWPVGSGRFRYWLYRKILRLVFAVHVRDVDCGFRLYRRAAIRRIPIQSDGRFANAEILAKATFMNMLIGEVAITTQPQPRRVANHPQISLLREAANVFRHPQFRTSNSASDSVEPISHSA